VPDIRETNTSIVVLGSAFSPPLLKHETFQDILAANPQGIVTPVLAQLTYPGGFQITLEESRFTVAHSQPSEGTGRLLSAAMSAFLSKNPLVSFTAMGLNFSGVVSGNGPSEDLLLKRIVVQEQLRKIAGSEPSEAALQIVYTADGARCQLAMQPQGNSGAKGGLLVHLNVHGELHSLDEIQSRLEEFERWHSHFRGVCRNIIGVEEGE
jgi:hypothetical protein